MKYKRFLLEIDDVLAQINDIVRKSGKDPRIAKAGQELKASIVSRNPALKGAAAAVKMALGKPRPEPEEVITHLVTDPNSQASKFVTSGGG